ncbi:MAG: ribonuclease activity regulator RraA [Alphaproteobacteria bacterium]|nr:ribonuclease activity regulator RraA [Alphaproteobacteria bacterium]
MTDIIAALAQVSTATLTTVMMRDHGLNNTAMRDLFPCNRDACRFAGPAVTARYLPLREDLKPAQYLDHPENLMRPLAEETAPGSVLVLDGNGRNDVGMLGSNLVMRMKMRGLAAAVTDGGMRDLPELAEINFPVFATASAAPPSFAKLMLVDVGGAVACGGVPVFAGDVIIGDAEGVVAVPKEIAAQVADAGRAMDEIEAYVHRRLARGEALPGLYPPGEKVRAEYEAWVKAGKPELEN